MDMASKKPETKVLVVDDEPTIRELLSASLRFAGFDVATAENGAEALKVERTFLADIVVLDIMLPDMDGFEVLTHLREQEPELPVLFLTAKDDVQDRVRGLEVGGDDYVTKPFSLEEVVARIHAILRRTAPESASSDVLRYHDLEMDESSYEVRRAGHAVDLSPTEYKLLRYLLINAERVVSKIQILDHVWDYNWVGEASIVESYISYLRRKIDSPEALGITDPDEVAALEPLIHTKRGIGYVLRRAK
ncbi:MULTISPECIES: response regulator transcription factor [Trueperella]|uniref:Response regulator transcription factor n=1 Tax=Trueperella bernardiae TaxID=59561 RepID=A0AAW6ZI43_9ACTO|nr:response regulator transcription factor [Trueperella bernardiae]OFS68095.1 DNA-binding response regulator [Trueperella sp. HMSC08H06]MCM3908095.1 response regulator transcription factor [Trueperella bernardiae]MDK8602029.1 response regulator transcription factor [Trueperella bernardiae]OCW59987.1 alkaline phosphatase [Trueperella bernardiae]PKZ88476.1 DNA-binding response regulator [Trueperella bernardiae]